MQEISRQEKKYLIDLEQYYHCSRHFEKILLQDDHNGADGYMIRSLYFDTWDDENFYEKTAGIETRRKIRLRLYNPAADFAMLEMKQKQGVYQLKRSLKLDREDAIRLCRGDYAPLLKYPEAFAAECYGFMSTRLYRPKAIMQYYRKAFIAKENHIRVTFDHDLRATESEMDIFAPHLPLYPVLDPFKAVLEVKYNNFLLSYIRELVNLCEKSELAVSKYCLSRHASLGYIL